MTPREATDLRARLFVALSIEDAKDIMGFPPGYMPSAVEVTKAYRALSLKYHPDRGGDARKMVELNVAKEILEGKRREDNTPRVDDDAATRERREKISRAISTIQSRQSKAEAAFAEAMSGADIQGYRLNLRDWLTEECAEGLDNLDTSIELNLRNASDPKAKAVLAKANTLLDRVGSLSLRLGQKYQALYFGLGEARRDKTLSSVQIAYEKRGAVIDALLKVMPVSRALSTLFYTSEEVPAHCYDDYFELHKMFLAFESDWKGLDQRALDKLRKEVEEGVAAVVEALAELDIDDPPVDDAPEYWEIPGSFERAKDLVLRSGPPGVKNASASRVVRRFLRKQ